MFYCVLQRNDDVCKHCRMSAVAGIDIGTNSVRLLVLDPQGGELARRATVTRLGQQVNATGRLHVDATTRTLDCLRTYKAEADALLAKRFRVTATSAARDASNGTAFLDQVAEIVGVQPDLLSGAEEGELSFAGAMSSFEPRVNGLDRPELDMMIDIGGGSTEFAVGRPGEPMLGVYSLDMGCVRFTELFMTTDPPIAEDLSNLISVAQAHLEDLERELPIVSDATRLIGVAGTITTVAAIELGRYDRDAIHRMWLSRAAAEDVFRTVAQERAIDRAHNPGLHPDRVGTIVAGAAIVVAILRHFDADGLFVSETDLLDALTRSLLNV